MPTAKLSGLVQWFSRPAPDLADGELLAHFVGTRDEAAFAELVRRYGPLVFAVCRRITGGHHPAEDAFQAVFVVLAAKAGSVRPVSALPAWLHGVATRTALRARTVADRRRRREAPLEAVPDAAARAAAPAEAADLAAVVDEEVARLPDRLRRAVVLCELEGCSRRDAAARLGVPEGTVSSRLAAARKALAVRLKKRGIALGAAGLSAALGTHATASVPAALAARALAAAVSPGTVSASVAVLSSGVLRVMFAQKLKTLLPLTAFVLGALACAALAASHDPVVPRSPAPAPALVLVPRFADPVPKAAPKPLPKGPNKLLVSRSGGISLIDPDGKNETKLDEKPPTLLPMDLRLAPDGKSVALLVNTEARPGKPPVKPVLKLYVRGVGEKEPGTDLGVKCRTFFWSGDGSEIVCSEFEDEDDKLPQTRHFIVNVKSRATEALKLPEGHIVTDWSRDGKFFLTTALALNDGKPSVRLHLVKRDGTDHKALTDDTQLVMTGKLSPDGKRIAYDWREVHTGTQAELLNKETETHLIVCDPDGKNAKTVLTEKGAGQWHVTLTGLDWR